MTMKTVHEAVQDILNKLKTTLTDSSFITEQKDYQQLLKIADKMGTTLPSQELFDAFAADDHGLRSRRKRHAMVLKRVDLETGLHAAKPDFRPYNPITLPSAKESEVVLSTVTFPLTEAIDIGYLIVRASVDLHSMNHKAKSIDDDYMDSMKSIHCFFARHGGIAFDTLCLDAFIEQSSFLTDSIRPVFFIQPFQKPGVFWLQCLHPFR